MSAGHLQVEWRDSVFVFFPVKTVDSDLIWLSEGYWELLECSGINGCGKRHNNSFCDEMEFSPPHVVVCVLTVCAVCEECSVCKSFNECTAQCNETLTENTLCFLMGFSC